MKAATRLPPISQAILELRVQSAHYSAVGVAACRSTVLKSINLCDVSTAQLILKVQVTNVI